VILLDGDRAPPGLRARLGHRDPHQRVPGGAAGLRASAAAGLDRRQRQLTRVSVLGSIALRGRGIACCLPSPTSIARSTSSSRTWHCSGESAVVPRGPFRAPPQSILRRRVSRAYLIPSRAVNSLTGGAVAGVSRLFRGPRTAQPKACGSMCAWTVYELHGHSVDMTSNVISGNANGLHGALPSYAQIFAHKVLWAIH
jgi:hypothetical protein